MDQLKTIITLAQLPATVMLMVAVVILWREVKRVNVEWKADRDSLLKKIDDLYNRLIDDPPKTP